MSKPKPPRPTELSRDPATRLRERIEYAVSEFGAAGGSIPFAAMTLMRAGATCAIVASHTRDGFVDFAGVAFDHEKTALASATARQGSGN